MNGQHKGSPPPGWLPLLAFVLLSANVWANAQLGRLFDFGPSLTPEEQKIATDAEQLHLQGAEFFREGRMGEAHEATGKAVDLRRRLYKTPKFPQGHEKLCSSLYVHSIVLRAMGRLDAAKKFGDEAMAMVEKFSLPTAPTTTHVDCAMNVAALAQVRGQLEQALILSERAVDLARKAYSPATYPDGHDKLAVAVHNLAMVHQDQGDFDRGLKTLREAIAIYEKLYPARDYPNGHRSLAKEYTQLATILMNAGKTGEALEPMMKGREMFARLYPKSSHPNGHPDLLTVTNNVGSLHESLGRYDEALDDYRECLRMLRGFQPPSHYPDGHVNQLMTLINLGSLLDRIGRTDEAIPMIREALAMDQRLTRRFLAAASESEAVDFLDKTPMTRDGFLMITANRPQDTEAAYGALWAGKLTITRVLEQRHTAARIAGTDFSAKLAQLRSARRSIEALLRDVRLPPAERQRRLVQANEQRDALERELAAAVPAMTRDKEIDALGAKALVNALPERTVLIDFVRYFHIEVDANKSSRDPANWKTHYAAFVLTKGRPIERVELGLAKPIDEAVVAWLAAIRRRRDRDEGGRVESLIWRPIAARIPAGTKTLYFAPDGELTRVPWAALPVRADRFLLEDFAIAAVPHGPFVLDRLRRPSASFTPNASLLVGALDYRSPYWPDLYGTNEELSDLSARLQRPTSLTKAEATPTQLADLLPKVEFAHFATHGFFDARGFYQDKTNAKRQMDTRKFGDAARFVAAKNPLGYVGLVLSDAQVFTGLSIVDLQLEKLKLVTLSACETGLGEVTDGEGVQGLQRAFHLAGCPNVVASLWKIPDVPTLVLMEEFYSRLWRKENPLPPIEALREAQLAVMRNPKKIFERLGSMRAELAKRGVSDAELQTRGFGRDLDKLPSGGAIVESSRSPTQWWAGFVLSGLGR